jgi:glycosyltransferase involved in cell wall biosynthesis
LAGLLAPGVRLVLLPVYLARDSPEYSAGWHRISLEFCEQAGAIVLPVDNGTGGQVRFGGVPAFEHLAISTARALRTEVLPAASWAQPYKGWDDLIEAIAALRDQGTPLPHALLAAVTDQPEPTAYQRHLADHIGKLGLDATLLTRFDPGIRDLLWHPALRAVVIPSRTEPFGRVPLEAYAAGAAPVVATTAGGLAEQVIDGVTGFTAAPADPASLASALRRALALSADERARMRAAGRDLARTRFDHRLAIQRFFAQTAPWACRAPDDQAGPETPP